jgi:hypothetical protein
MAISLKRMVILISNIFILKFREKLIRVNEILNA